MFSLAHSPTWLQQNLNGADVLAHVFSVSQRRKRGEQSGTVRWVTEKVVRVGEVV